MNPEEGGGIVIGRRIHHRKQGFCPPSAHTVRTVKLNAGKRGKRGEGSGKGDRSFERENVIKKGTRGRKG